MYLILKFSWQHQTVNAFLRQRNKKYGTKFPKKKALSSKFLVTIDRQKLRHRTLFDYEMQLGNFFFQLAKR